MSIEPDVSEPKRSAVEAIKENSRQLRGTLAEELAKESDHFSDQDKQLIKFHGSYQQDNRDARKDRHREGGGKSGGFMIRCRIPGGKVTASQYLAIDDLAEKYANGTLRITSRQAATSACSRQPQANDSEINDCLLTTSALRFVSPA